MSINCAKCSFWSKNAKYSAEPNVFISAVSGYLIKPRGYCEEKGLVICYDEGCEQFKDKDEEDNN